MRVGGLGLSLLKGAAPERLVRLPLASHGPVGDRRLCCVDPTAARVLRTVENPLLLRLRARLLAGGPDDADPAAVLEVDVPGRPPLRGPVVASRRLRADYWGRAPVLDVLSGPWAPALSAHLGREVVLARAAPRDVVYGGGVTLVTTSSLRELARRAGTADGEDDVLADAGRWRATLVVATADAPPFVEDSWCGRTLAVGDVRLRVGAPVARCAVVRLRPGDGAREGWDPLALLAPDRRRAGEVAFGVEAEVARPGTLHVGDPVAVL